MTDGLKILNNYKETTMTLKLSDLTWNTSSAGAYYTNLIDITNEIVPAGSKIISVNFKDFSKWRNTDNFTLLIAFQRQFSIVANTNSFVTDASVTMRILYL